MTGVEDRSEHTFKNGAKYKGQWKGEMRHGYGEQTWADGAKYAGDWRLNKAHGKGTFWHVTGDKYEGQWVGGLKHGPKGIFTRASDQTILVAEWKGDRANVSG